MEYEVTIKVVMTGNGQGDCLQHCENAITGGKRPMEHPNGLRVIESSVKVIRKKSV